MPKILTFNGVYIPGYKAGGPIRSIANIAENLHDEFDFYILARDRDKGDTKPYQNIKVDDWNKVRDEKVFYHSDKRRIINLIKEVISSKRFDIIYLNGFFSEYTISYLLLRRLRLVPSVPVIISPRGDLSHGALSIKNMKKSAFIKGTKILGIYNNLHWQATSDIELEDIRSVFGGDISITKVENLPTSNTSLTSNNRKIKELNKLKIVFLSRITKKKNLKYALEILRDIQGKVEFNIYGPIANEDKLYWEECLKIIETLPQNIVVKYKGSINHNEINSILLENDIFLFPTLGENYGHVIIEALSAGCPVIISDKTPWINLEQNGAGWDIPLEHPQLFKIKIQQLIGKDNEYFSNLSENAKKYINKTIDRDSQIVKMKELFYKVLMKDKTSKHI
ncbi:glycosyltransferase family 4 protein [Neobacillus drentensis]|uniref:glycosyltransferase family 4 protein n=1 Tax=Neobacillus drentensis TaxID=220684 RepID=UPI002FFDA5C6